MFKLLIMLDLKYNNPSGTKERSDIPTHGNREDHRRWKEAVLDQGE